MSPGQLNKKVQIASDGQVSNGSGGFENGLVPVKTVWANIDPLGGREFYEAQAANASVTHKITIRYWSGLKRSHVFSYKDRVFEIQYIINVNEADRFMEIQALERV